MGARANTRSGSLIRLYPQAHQFRIALFQQNPEPIWRKSWESWKVGNNRENPHVREVGLIWLTVRIWAKTTKKRENGFLPAVFRSSRAATVFVLLNDVQGALNLFTLPMSSHRLGDAPVRTVEEEAASIASSPPRARLIPPYSGPDTDEEKKDLLNDNNSTKEAGLGRSKHVYSTPGHIFCVHGDLSKLACDAWMVSIFSPRSIELIFFSWRSLFSDSFLEFFLLFLFKPLVFILLCPRSLL